MAKTSTNISIDTDIKAKAQELFADLGLDLSTAINMFLHSENANFPIVIILSGKFIENS